MGVGVWALVALACSPAQPLSLPIQDDTQAVLLVVPESKELTALDTAGDLGAVGLRRTQATYARTFNVPLASLGVAPGRHVLFGAGEGRAPIPGPAPTFILEFDGEVPRWTPLPEPEGTEVLEALFLDTASCVSAGGCWRTLDGQPQCALPCPAPPQVREPAPPNAPNPPMLSPCPSGWVAETSSVGEELRWCRPTPFDCGPEAFRTSAEDNCNPEPCPADGWPVEVPPTAIFVDAAATTRGDGTRAAPFAQLTEAIAAAGAGSVVALRAGQYQASVAFNDLSLVGACRSGTILTGLNLRLPTLQTGTGASVVRGLTIRGTGPSPALRVSAAHVQLQGVNVEGGPGGGVLVSTGSTLTAERTMITGAGLPLAASRSRIQLDGAWIRGQQSRECVRIDRVMARFDDVDVSGCGASGLSISGGDLRATRLSVTDVVANGLVLTTQAVAEIDGLYLTRALVGVDLSTGADLHLSRFFLGGLRSRGLNGLGSAVNLEDGILYFPGDRGVSLDGNQVGLRRIAITGAGTYGLRAINSEFMIEDLRVRFPRPARGSGTAGAEAISIGGQARIQRVIAEVDYGSGLRFGPGRLDLTDAEVIGSSGGSGGRSAVWVLGSDDTEAKLDRIAVRSWPDRGIHLFGSTTQGADWSVETAADTALLISNSVVDSQRIHLYGTFERGVQLDGPAALTDVTLTELAVDLSPGAKGLINAGIASGQHSAQLEAFRFSGPGEVGFELDAVFRMRLGPGKIVGPKLGMRLRDPTFELADIEQDVYFDDVDRVIELICTTDAPGCVP